MTLIKAGRIALLVTVFFFAHCPLIIAFEGDEHRRISDLSIKLAVDFICNNAPDSGTETNGNISKEIIVQRCEEISHAENSLDRGDTLSYGTINELVDFMHYPGLIFEANNSIPDGRTDGKPTSIAHLNQHVIGMQKKSFALFDYLSSSSNNERHFQDDLLKSMHDLHQMAIDDAKNGYIFSALVYNALSDHFLNDYFAPGHITTARENSHDAIALAMHDRANRAGSCFVPDKSKWKKDIEPLLEFLKNDKGIRKYDLLITDKIRTKSDIKRTINNFRDCGNTISKSEEEHITKILNKDLIDNAVYERFIIESLIDRYDKVYFLGDGRLDYNPRQQIFMLAVQVKSISEVLETYIYCSNNQNSDPCHKKPSELTTFYQWKGTYNFSKTDPRVQEPIAKILYGEYKITYNKNDNSQVEDIDFFMRRPKYAYPVIADNAFLLSLGGQTPISQESSRLEAQLELFPMRIGSAIDSFRDKMVQRPSKDCLLKSLCNVGLSYGVTYLDDDYFNATSFQFRVIKAFPKISGLLSVNARRGRYRGYLGGDEWGTTYGIRYDHGFSLHSFYIGYQRDYRYDVNNFFDQGNVVSFGWSINFPSSRLLGYFGGYK